MEENVTTTIAVLINVAGVVILITSYYLNRMRVMLGRVVSNFIMQALQDPSITIFGTDRKHAAFAVSTT